VSLLEIENLPSMASVGHALVELAQPQLAKAWVHVADWDGLTRARVPAPLRRELLDRDSLGESDFPTEATAAIDEWEQQGARAPRLIVGDLGTGKSFGGARWCQSRHRSGRSSLWVSVATWSSFEFDDLRLEQRKALDADALVLDDLGVGANLVKVRFDKSGKEHRELSWIGEGVQSLLLDRTNEGRPTLVLMNGDPRACLNLLGKRVLDRLKLVPGRPVSVISSTTSLRKPAPLDPPDAAGRGRVCRSALYLLEVFGAEDSAGKPMTFGRGDRVIGETPTFGRSLMSSLRASERWADPAERVRVLAGVDTVELLERARQVEIDDAAGSYWSAETQRMLAQLATDIAKGRRATTAAQAKQTAAIVEPARRRYASREDEGAWRDGHYGKLLVPDVDVAKLRELGYRVDPGPGGWALRHVSSVETTSGKKSKRKSGKKPEPSVLSLDHPTDDDAWALANALAFGKPRQQTA
jgi:hypothetical protein